MRLSLRSQIGLFGVFFLVSVLFRAGSAYAISNSFLGPANTSSSETSLVVEKTASVDVSKMMLKWFIPDGDTGDKSITLTGFCASQNYNATMLFKKYDASLGWVDVTPVVVYSNYNGLYVTESCSGDDLVVSGVSNAHFATQGALYPGYRVLLIEVELRASSGITKFNAVGQGGTFITQAEIGGSPSAQSTQPASSVSFAILGNKTNTYGYDTKFSFRADCSEYTGAQQERDYYLHWRDVDYDKSYGDQTTWELVESATGNLAFGGKGPDAGSSDMGGSNEHKSQLVRLKKGVLYEWRWQNVNHLNTVHIWMPFSEITQFIECDTPNTPPSGSLITSCDDTGRVDVFARVSDHEGGRLTVSGGFSGQGDASADIPIDVVLAVSPFNGTRDNTNHGISATLTDPGGASATITGSYKCKFPPPAIVIVCTAGTIEVNDAYLPRASFTHSTAGAEDATVSVSFSLVADNIGGLPFTNVSKSASVYVPKGTTKSAGLSADTLSSDSKFVSDSPVVLTAPGTYKVSYAATWTTASGLSGSVSNSPCVGTVNVVAKPYFRVLGGDIWSTSGAPVRGHNKERNLPGHYTPASLDDPSGKSGSGTQGLLVGSGEVQGVASGVMLVAGLAVKPLTFANTAPLASTDVQSVRAKSTYGGGFGNFIYAIPSQDPGAVDWSPVGSTPGAGLSAVYKHTPVSGTVNFHDSSVPPGSRMTVYVTGDLAIDGDIIYSNSGGYGDYSQIPHIRFVVRKSGATGGNIRIASTVHRIDAELIAEGEINTCDSPDNKYPACASTLLVNGTLLAARVSLNRLNGTARSSTPDDGKMSGCALAAPLLNNYCNYVNIGEIIQFSPELYMSTPADEPDIPLGNRYDSITSLPPRF